MAAILFFRHSKSKKLKGLDLEWLRNSNVRYSSPHCTTINLNDSFRRKRDGDGDTVSLNEMSTTSAENGNAHKKLSDWRNKLASKFKKSVGEQVHF